MSSHLYRNHNGQEEGTGNQALQGKSGGVPGKGQDWPFDPGPVGHKDRAQATALQKVFPLGRLWLHTAASQKVSLLEHLRLHMAALQKVSPLEYPLLFYTLIRSAHATHKSCHGSFVTNNCALYTQYTHTR